MKVGDKIKVVKDNHSTMKHFVGFIGEVVTIIDNSLPGLNIGVSFKQEDNKEFLYKFNMIGDKVLYFDIDEIDAVEL